MSKGTKLRFALITEDVLDKLRPRSQSESVRSCTMNDMFSAIKTAVNEAVDAKLESLNDNINQMVDEKVARLLGKQPQDNQRRPTVPGGIAASARRSNPKTTDPKDRKALKDTKSTTAQVGKTAPNPKPKNTAPELICEQCLKKHAGKSKRIMVRPSHRDVCEKSIGKNVLTAAIPSSSIPSSVSPSPGINIDLDEDYSDVEEPSILTIAARYLKQLEDARRRKQQQQQQQQRQLA
ncbi:hypothetical protein KR018_006733 [Drosophila ironensis]|nr:hypothetical protein KR018_006733 [Drosophila ironensis]